MRKQASLILVVIIVSALTVALNIRSVYAAPSLGLTPNPVTQGTDVQVTGSGFPNENGFLDVFADNTGSCSGTVFFAGSVSALSGSFSTTISTVGLSVGTHCVETDAFVIPGTETADNAASTLIVNSVVVPEYPLGLTVLAIFIALGYTIIRRRLG